ncbi:hypothetical protein N9484_05955 [Polaribacter sp.]|nr:hypothetical protein [Polaribacter sp.]MDB4182016.1 hypothetical protein [Polaribacter sp.]
MKNIKIIKNRSHIGVGIRGADMEIASINLENSFFNTWLSVDVKTHNETI